MLDGATLRLIESHSVSHRVGYCNCPCFPALIKVAEALQKEGELRVKLAKVSPDVLAALTIAGGYDNDEIGTERAEGSGVEAESHLGDDDSPRVEPD